MWLIFGGAGVDFLEICKLVAQNISVISTGIPVEVAEEDCSSLQRDLCTTKLLKVCWVFSLTSCTVLKADSTVLALVTYVESECRRCLLSWERQVLVIFFLLIRSTLLLL